MDNMQQISQILTTLLLILLPVAIIIKLYYFIMPTVRGVRNRRQPVITTLAEVIGNDTNSDNVIYSSNYTRDGGTVRYVTFRTADGKDVTLTVSREIYWAAEPGVTGTLTYQGTKCERFDPDP